MSNAKSVVYFEEVGKRDISIVGGKGASLGELYQAGIPVPKGFVVTAQTYYGFLEGAKLESHIQSAMDGLDCNDSEALAKASQRVKEAIKGAPLPKTIAQEIVKAYRSLGQGPVAVRSSATAEDLPDASFAGQQSTFLNIVGDDNVVRAVQECWASLFEPRAIFYRWEQGFDHLKVGIAVVVQRMVQSQTSGVLFTVDPISNNPRRITIEAVLGLGEAIVSGAITPDYYVVDKENVDIVERKPALQTRMLVRNPKIALDSEDANVWVDVAQRKQGSQKLTNDQIVALAHMAKRIEKLYDSPQDIEWAQEDGNLYIVQSRPITTLSETPNSFKDILKRTSATVLVRGASASPGIAQGPVKIIRDASVIHLVEKGDILVTEMTTPDFVPAMKKAAAIVTDKGGRTCHAAIVSRELGVPCIVGTETATHVLHQGQKITVDASQGIVYQGYLDLAPKEELAPHRRLKTTTRVYVNLADPELADAVAAKQVDGVGLLRAEFIIRNTIGVHPLHALSQGKGQEWTDKLAVGLEKFCAPFYPRPVVYRTTDFKTNEYRHLEGGKEYEEEEENPMMGYRGCSRYVREQEALRLEVEAILKVYSQYDNLHVMLPFVRTPEELALVKEVLDSQGLRRDGGPKLWMMVEIPSNIILMDQFIDMGLDGISIGSNDLTQLILGIDRDNEKLANLFDERHPAVLWALERAITIARARGITSSICGQAPSFFPDLTEKLVRWGISSVSVSPDMIDQTRDIIAVVEGKLGKLPPQDES
ncbi:MAG: ppsA [Dehalococcoidia bacterium]|nr:ppsA [Dehalococcoidia bacterium]